MFTEIVENNCDSQIFKKVDTTNQIIKLSYHNDNLALLY